MNRTRPSNFATCDIIEANSVQDSGEKLETNDGIDDHHKLDKIALKLFFFCNLRIGCALSRVFAPGKPFQHRLMFLGKARSLPKSEVSLSSLSNVCG
jgi:hypothetical protein